MITAREMAVVMSDTLNEMVDHLANGEEWDFINEELGVIEVRCEYTIAAVMPDLTGNDLLHKVDSGIKKITLVVNDYQYGDDCQVHLSFVGDGYALIECWANDDYARLTVESLIVENEIVFRLVDSFI